MTKSTITRERAQQIFLGNGPEPRASEERELARMALAAMDSEPVIVVGDDGGDALSYRRLIQSFEPGTKLYRHAQPAKGLELAGWQFKSVNGDWLGLIGEHGKNQAVREGCEVREVFAMADGVNDRDHVRRQHAEWSQATFGNVGPVGPLKHLSKEALEAAAEPGDLSEWADMQFLLWDSQRRAGITDEQITQAMIEKLAVNKQRSWPEPKDGEPRLHIKEQPAPVVPEEWTIADAVKFCKETGRQDAGAAMDAWNARRAAMLQASPVCTYPSGDSSLRWPCPVHPGNSPAQSDCCPEQNSVNPAQGGNYLVIPDEMTSEQAYEIGYYYGDPVDVFARGANWMRKHIIDSTLAAGQQSPGSEPATVPGKWIPVSERMPENDGAYLCWDNRYVTTYAFIFGAWQANQFVAKNITHWMPLPAAPREVK